MNTKSMALSSTSSSRTPTSTARNHSETYFPGCRKDANCHCEICIASFNSTRDLHSALRFPPKKHNPISLSSMDPYTPPSTPEPVSSVSITPPRSLPMKSTAKSRPIKKSMKKERGRAWGVGYKVLVVLVGVWVFFAVDSGVLEVVLKGFEPKLGPEMVRGLGEEVKDLGRGLKEKLRIVEWKVKGVVGGGDGKVSNCSFMDSGWKLNQEGHHLMFQWRCVIYQTMTEELSVWGSPLPTSGILAAGLSPRTLTLLSGRITEWSEEKLVSTSRMCNGSAWTLEKWSTAAVQLEGETWVLEYRRSALFQGPGLVQSAWEILRHRTEMMAKRLKWRLLLSRNFGSSRYHISSRERRRHFKHPT